MSQFISDRLFNLSPRRELPGDSPYVMSAEYPLYDHAAATRPGYVPGAEGGGRPLINARLYRAPALLCDLDGTVRGSVSGREFHEGADDIGIYPNVAEKLAAYRNLGFLILGVTNQGGVAHGFKNLEDVWIENERTNELLGGLFDVIYACPCMETGKVFPFDTRSPSRKPAMGMFAVLEFLCYMHLDCQIDWNRSIMVGDRAEDSRCAATFQLAFFPAQRFFETTDPGEAPPPP